MMISRSIFTAIIFALVVFMGCSGGGKTPLTPTPGEQFQTPQSSGIIPVGVSDWSSDGKPLAGTGTLGIFSLHLNPASLQGDLTSLRSGATQDVLEVVDITNFLQLAPCTTCVKLHSISLNVDNHLVVSIGVKHPFTAGDPYKPITGRNRADLHVFNVEGFIISDGTSTTEYSQLGATVGGFKLVNADGYSGYLDASWDGIFPTVATIHPYITHFDDYSSGNFDEANPMGFGSVTDPPPTGNLVMAMGCDESIKDYELDIPLDGDINLIYSVGCTYAISAANKSQRFTPEYRIPQHNKKAASEVSVEIADNHLIAGDPTSTATLRVKVVDINHGVSVGDALNQMRADSSVGSVQADIPGLTLGVITLPSTPVSGTGHNPSDPLVFETQITNETSTLEGIFYGLVKVTDTYPVGLNESPLLNGKDGITRVDPLINPLTGVFDIPEFATYQTFVVDVTFSIPDDLVYNLKLSTVRNTTHGVTALRLDWDSQQDITDYHIYVKDPFDSLSVFTLLDDGVNTNNFYEDASVAGNQGYEYYVVALFGTTEANPSNHVLGLLENAEDNLNTTSVWEKTCGHSASPTWQLMEWNPCTNYPANGTYNWNPRGIDYIVSTTCEGWWTGSFSLLCSPVIPIPSGASTAYLEFNVMVNTLDPQYNQAGGSVGIADVVNYQNYYPTNDFKEGWAYNCTYIIGLDEAYTNIDTTNAWGYAYRVGYTYHYAAYYVPDMLTRPNARAAFAWAASNTTTWGLLNFDDMAVIVY